MKRYLPIDSAFVKSARHNLKISTAAMFHAKPILHM
jgi:hypothetical protein